jgi:hypothetical protein
MLAHPTRRAIMNYLLERPGETALHPDIQRAVGGHKFAITHHGRMLASFNFIRITKRVYGGVSRTRFTLLWQGKVRAIALNAGIEVKKAA